MTQSLSWHRVKARLSIRKNPAPNSPEQLSEKQITQLYGDSANFDFSPYAGRMGLVFVDGSHSYDYVLQDTASALRLASDHASFCGMITSRIGRELSAR